MRTDDLIIAVAYFSIPLEIAFALARYPQFMTMPWSIVVLAVLFAFFIFFCGAVHLLHCLGVSSGAAFRVLNVATAIVSLATALYLLPMVPHLFSALNSALVMEIESRQNVMTFMSFLCHEIRNPLFSMTSTVTFMGDDESMSQEQRSSLESMQQSVNLMMRLVNDVLNLSKVESGELELEERPIDLIKLMEGVFVSFRILIGQKTRGAVQFHVEISESVPRFVLGDSVRLLQIIYNMLNNSSNFADKGTIRLHVDVVPFEKAIANDWIDVSKLDPSFVASSEVAEFHDELDKILMAAEVEGPNRDSPSAVVLKFQVTESCSGTSSHQHHEHFLEPCNSSRSKKSNLREHGGTGIGLSIISRLTEIMGGSIDAQSRPGKGSTFTVFIPSHTTHEIGRVASIHGSAEDDYQHQSTNDNS